MKKNIINLIFAFILIALSFVGFTREAHSNALDLGRAHVISSKCDVYLSPSFTSEKLKIDDIVISLRHGDIVEIVDMSGDFAEIKTDKIKSGFVYKYYLTDNSSITLYPVFNGSIRKETTIFDIDKEDSGLKAKKGDRVYLYEGFKKDEDGLVSVQIVLEDGSLYNGFVNIEDVKPDGVSGLLIVGISIIVAGVTIILSLLFIKKKKVKKDKKRGKK